MASPFVSSRAVAGDAARAGLYRPPQAYAVLAFLVWGMISLELVRLSIIILVDPIRRSFNIGDVQVSLLLGAMSSVPFVAMSLVGGALSDRLSRKLLLSFAIMFWVSGAIVCATATGFAAFATGRVLIGIGAGMKLPIAMTWINDAFPPARRGRAIGVFFVALGTGPSFAVMLAGIVQGWALSGTFSTSLPIIGGGEPWRATIAVLTLPSLAALLVLPMLLDARGHVIETSTGQDGRDDGIGRMALVIAGAALVALVDAGNLAWVSTIFIRDFSFDAAKAGAIFGVATLIAGLSGPLIGGTLGDVLFRRFGQSGRLMLAGGAALAIAPLLASYLLHLPGILISALTLSGICTVTALSLSYVTVQAELAPRARGLGTGIMSATTTLVGSAGPTLVALVAGRLDGGGSAMPGSLTVAVTIVAGSATLIAAGLFFTCAMKVEKDQPPTASAV